METYEPFSAISRSQPSAVKACARCKRQLAESEFYGDSTSKDGLRSQCKECERESSRRYYRAHSGRLRRKSRRWYLRARRDKLRQLGRQWKNLSPQDIPQRIKKRFWSKVRPCGWRGCWPWRGSRRRSGHGLFSPVPGIRVLAHRFAWFLTRGPIPQGVYVRQCCGNRSCIRPDHLFLGNKRPRACDRPRLLRRCARFKP